jgi:hypothetical protein
MTGKALKAERGQPVDSGETRAAVALTVAWMLTCMSTAVGSATVLVLRVLMAATVGGGGRHPLATVAEMLLAVAAFTGLLCLLFTPLTLRIRRSQPPRSIVICAVLIGLAPLAMIAAVALGAF